MLLIMTAFPDLHDQTVESAAHYVLAPLSAQSICLAVLGGAAITLMTRMQHGTDSMPAKIAAAVAGAFLLAGLQMFHSILDSLLIFGALTSGEAPFGYLDWLAWFAYVAPLNVFGGRRMTENITSILQGALAKGIAAERLQRSANGLIVAV